jgi:hypothetical protein
MWYGKYICLSYRNIAKNLKALMYGGLRTAAGCPDVVESALDWSVIGGVATGIYINLQTFILHPQLNIMQHFTYPHMNKTIGWYTDFGFSGIRAEIAE